MREGSTVQYVPVASCLFLSSLSPHPPFPLTAPFFLSCWAEYTTNCNIRKDTHTHTHAHTLTARERGQHQQVATLQLHVGQLITTTTTSSPLPPLPPLPRPSPSQSHPPSIHPSTHHPPPIRPFSCSVLPVPPTLPARCGDAAKPHFHDWTFVALLILSTSLNHWHRTVRLPISSHDRLPIRSHNLPVPSTRLDSTLLALSRLASQVNLETSSSHKSSRPHLPQGTARESRAEERHNGRERRERHTEKEKETESIALEVYCFATGTS
ncbi:hypothetical protein CDEST_08741 [Colletotrichum destructivum]|uniref:Uncharacterized protein n=1 Tax=Colletotrichum destructivum TaxID=34406 RepID=A0AAX4IK11_9PEZI|nr:hypothetical protein CDEST_08741 [Colletotrichum destructivum]